jgi:hypothetical protein
MKGTRNLSGYLFLLASIAGPALMLVAAVAPVSAGTDDWSRVSAPPPPGPYRTVNLDPRVPGQEGSPAIGNVPRFSRPPGNIMPETKAAAPAAGGHAYYETPVNQLPPQVPGAYQTRRPRPPVNTYPGSSRYPAQTGGQNFGTMPSRKYYSSQPSQPEQVVPPPPVYDAMMRAPPGTNPANTGR